MLKIDKVVNSSFSNQRFLNYIEERLNIDELDLSKIYETFINNANNSINLRNAVRTNKQISSNQ